MGKKNRLHPGAAWMGLCCCWRRTLPSLAATLCLSVLAACAASTTPIAPRAVTAFASARLEPERQRLIRQRKQERLRDHLHIRDHDSRLFDAR